MLNHKFLSTFNGRIVKLFKDAQVHVFCFHQCSLHKLLLIHGNFKTIYMHLYFYFGNIQTEIKISVYYSLMYSSTRLLYVFIVVKYPFLITVIWSTCQWLFLDRTSFDGRYDMRDDDRNIQFELDHLATFSSRSGFKSKHTSLYKMHFIAKTLALFYLYIAPILLFRVYFWNTLVYCKRRIDQIILVVYSKYLCIILFFK